MKTFALILSTLSVALATYLPQNTRYTNRQLVQRTLSPRMVIVGSNSGRTSAVRTAVNPIISPIGQRRSSSSFLAGASLGQMRAGPRMQRRLIINPNRQTSTFTAGASGRGLARASPYMVRSNRASVPSRRAFIGTIRSSPNGRYSVTPVSSSMNVGSRAVVLPSGGTRMAPSFVGGSRRMPGLNTMSVNGVQQRFVNPYQANRRIIYSGGGF